MGGSYRGSYLESYPATVPPQLAMLTVGCRAPTTTPYPRHADPGTGRGTVALSDHPVRLASTHRASSAPSG